ncbi:MAG: DUF1592 domain-containing protein [Prosthecobacter sp.]|uniref:DUF1592 domain-containing protein n=1 Tax=Prosthecobacter sp. TaxID=1965333 RepID=UPI0025F10997|nr:DUF1592 domain-containing protein [Prosthecobacter sp.]MCF7787582.1 DUF1592 domain-containing protein [Prosthecobacter sp.]
MTRFFVLFILASAASAATLPPVTPFLEKHCTECHDGDVKKGGLDLTALAFKPEDRKNFDLWVKVYDRVNKGEMPPAKKPRPEAAALQSFQAALKTPLRGYELAEQTKNGRTVLRRLNRTEYENTVHDLLGISLPLKHILPEDTPLHGFDTVAEGLRFSQLQIEKYLEAADAALDAAIVLSKRPVGINQRYSYKKEEGIRKNLDTPPGTLSDKTNPKSGHRVMFRENEKEVIMFTTGDYLVGLKQCRLPGPGNYRIKVSGNAFQSEGEPLTLMICSNNYKQKRLLSYCELPADKPREFEFTTRLDGSEHIVINCDRVGRDKKGQNIYNVGAAEFLGTGLAMQWIEVEGPLSAEWPPASLKKALGDVPLTELDDKKRKYRDGKQLGYELAPTDVKQAITSGLNGFAARAFRRPLEKDEAGPYIALAAQSLDAGSTFEDALRVGLRAVLTSPAFLLLEEHPGRLSDLALATRLAYFLTSSMPDDELMKVAGEGKLTQPAVLKAQTERLLKSPRAEAFVTNFVGQWLELRNIDATSPDTKLYPEYDMLLKLGMVSETEAFFSELLSKNLPVSNLIHSDFAMVNSRLAEHYELPGIAGEEFRRVSLPKDSPRGGVLTQASVLKVTANGTVTSPVIRGAWVMKHLLGQPPAPPPASVGAIEPDTRGTTTIREQLAKHRDSETCATCHRQIDPPGFALECFDVIGGFRENYRSNEKGANVKRKLRGQNIWQYKEGLPVDASGELEDGRKFQGITEFKKLLLEQQDQVMRALAGNLVTYGTGAGIQFADRDAIEAISKQAKADGSGVRSLVHAVVQSPLFLSK